MSDFLNKTFRSFDRAVFAGMHALHNAAGGFFDGLCEFVSFLADGGWCYIAAAIVLMLFCKTRKIGLAMGIALALGALVTNIIVKNAVQRPRPFTQSEEFWSWWQAAGASKVDSYSFPSGHTTASFAAMTAFFAVGNKKYSWTGWLFALLVAFSRVYLVVHYTTDVLAGFIIGTLAGVGGFFLCKLIYAKAGGKFKTLLCEIDAIWVVKKLKAKKSGQEQENAAPEEPHPINESEASEETDAPALQENQTEAHTNESDL